MLFEIAILVTQLLLLVGVLTYIAYSTARGLSGYMDVPYVATPRRLLPAIADALNIRPLDIVYDLGCGDGRLLFYCAQRFPQAQFIGIERNPLLVFFAQTKRATLGLKNISFLRENIFETDFSNATRIYAFLLPELMYKLFAPDTNKIISSHRMRLVSRAFKVRGRESTKTIALPNVKNTCGEQELHVYEW